jgi:hypothetical protein
MVVARLEGDGSLRLHFNRNDADYWITRFRG